MASNTVVVVKRGLLWKPHKHDEILRELHAKRLYDHQIAYRMGFARNTVTFHRNRLGLPKWPYVAPAKPYYQPTEKERYPGNINLDITPLEAAKIYLGRRYHVKNGNLWLDNCPSNLNTIMKAANKVMHNMGLPQITSNPAWEYTPC